jgi:hypothetical protein
VRRALAIAATLGLWACVEVAPPVAPAPGTPAAAPRPLPIPEPFAPTGRPGQFVESVDATVFQRGNLHTHSTESDGDSPPEAVYAWYRDHGYNFLALSDHNRLTDPGKYRQLERPGFVILPAEEITLRPNKVPVHVNAICERSRIGGAPMASVGQALQWGVARVLEQGGVALINHPNFKWAFGAEALPAARGAQLLEIWSGHPGVHPAGDTAHSSEEAIWDAALTMGLDFAPAAVDDMHRLGAEADLTQAGPGRGWVEVFAAHASAAEICAALAHRQLFASNGARLRRLRVSGDAIEVSPEGANAVVDFIGRTGALLERVGAPGDGSPAVYRLRGGEGYVRARVTTPSGARAWTAAYRVAEQ